MLVLQLPARDLGPLAIARSTRSPTASQLGLKHDGLRPIGAEGARTGQWALLDYGDFVVHVFLHSAREHYDLEGLWNDAPRVPIDVPRRRAHPGRRAATRRSLVS